MTAPGYLDLQVNGYAGVDFCGEKLEVEAVAAACSRLREEGTAGILATVITDRIDSMSARLARIAELREQDETIRQMIRGVHIEGPFLSEVPGYIGAHPADCAMPSDVDAMKQLLDAAAGLTRIVTLAPERDSDFRVTGMLADQGIVVSAGHCNPALDELRGAVDAGLTMFTHLGNGCPLEMHRHDNIVQRVLSLADRLWIGFIADGVHVPFHALANYLRCAGIERSFVVTDAISAAGLGPGTYTLGGQQVVVDESLATWAADKSHLMGSAGTMPASAENLRNALGLSDEQVERLTCANPRRAIGMSPG